MGSQIAIDVVPDVRNMTCSNCKAENLREAEFCRGCGNLLAVRGKQEPDLQRGWLAALGPERAAAILVLVITLAAVPVCWAMVLYREWRLHFPWRILDQQSHNPEPNSPPAVGRPQTIPKPHPGSPLEEAKTRQEAPQQSSTDEGSTPAAPRIALRPSTDDRQFLPLQKPETKLPVSSVKKDASESQSPVSEPLILNFGAEPASIESGGSTVLRWSVNDSTNVKIEPELGQLPASGERAVSPQQTTQYTLTAEGPDGKTSAQLRVHVADPQVPSVFFEAVPQNIKQRQATELRWSTQNAEHVSIEPDIGVQSKNGSISISPQRTTRYTLTADGPGGSSAKDVLVSVSLPGPSAGEIVWSGTVHGVQLVTVDRDQADTGSLQGALPGLPCIIQPSDEHHVSIASSPGPRNNYERLVFRVAGNGPVHVTIKWSLL